MTGGLELTAASIAVALPGLFATIAQSNHNAKRDRQHGESMMATAAIAQAMLRDQ